MLPINAFGTFINILCKVLNPSSILSKVSEVIPNEFILNPIFSRSPLTFSKNSINLVLLIKICKLISSILFLFDRDSLFFILSYFFLSKSTNSIKSSISFDTVSFNLIISSSVIFKASFIISLIASFDSSRIFVPFSDNISL